MRWMLFALCTLAACSSTDRAAPSAARRPPERTAATVPDGAPVSARAPDAEQSEPADGGAHPAELPARIDDMLLVPGGPFTMGADEGGEADEHPAHTVTLGPFYLDATEVTNEAYGRCVAAKVCRPPDPRSAK